MGQARQFRPDLGLRPLAGLRKRPLRWRPGPGGAGNRRGPRRGTRMAEIPRIPGNRPERPASEAHTTAFSGPDARDTTYRPTAASNRHHAAAQGTSWRLVGCREAHSRRRRPRGAPMDESSQPLANGTSATLRPPMVARASSGLARAAAWPGLPAAQAVQLVNVNAEGAPALDRPADVKGLEKRTHGSTVGAVAIFGNPALALAFAPVRVAEGIADALALAARYEGPAVATLGTAGLRDQTETLTNWLTNAPRGVMVHADDDANAAGAEAARVLCRRIRLNGAEARAVFPPTGKDAAEAASRRPFADLQGYFAEYAETLRVMYPDWPRWEIARVAAIATEEL